MAETIGGRQEITPNLDNKNNNDSVELERVTQENLTMKKALISIKLAEARDGIKAHLNDFNKKISGMNSDQISEFINDELDSHINLMESSFEKIPQEKKQLLIDGMIKSSEYLRSRAVDGNLDEKEVEEMIQLQLSDMEKIMDTIL